MRMNLRRTSNCMGSISALALLLICGMLPLANAADSPEPKKSLGDVLKPTIESHKGDVGIAVKHLKTGETYEYKADQPMPTASLIKLPVMIATYEAVDKGKFESSRHDRVEEGGSGRRLRDSLVPLFTGSDHFAARRDPSDDRVFGQYGDEPRAR